MQYKQFVLIPFVLFALAGALLIYPWISIIASTKYHSDVETVYTNAIKDADNAELAEQRRAAEAYNALLRGEAAVSTGGASAPPMLYAGQLTVGGAGTHAVLSAHSGMASAKLFSDIDQLVKGDVFYIHVLGEVLAYEVDQIATVLPSDTSLLQIEDGQDLVTLVTCTPFGVNTHRLLARGHRVPYVPELVVENGKTPKAASSWTQRYLTGLGIGLGVLAAAGGGCVFVRRQRRG